MSAPAAVCPEVPKTEKADVVEPVAEVNGDGKVEALEKELQKKCEECDALKKQNARLELDLEEANMRGVHRSTEAAEVHQMKEESEQMLTRAKSMIFEKTKVCKNQELQIDALKAQITSLKDVVSITKNLLEIRSIEVTHLQEQMDSMAKKINAEKERQNLVHSKLETMIRMNADLKREYETQLVLFNALRDKYTERELAKGVLPPPVQPTDSNSNNSSNGSDPK